MPGMRFILAVSVAACLQLSVANIVTASPHTAGQCAADTPNDRCERWSTIFNDPTIVDPARSDQFVTGVDSNASTVFVALKDVALDPNDPYAAGGRWVVIAYDLNTGAERWRSVRQSRAYDMPLALTTSRDGSRVFVTGAAYDGFPVGATDSRLVTVAYDAASGAELWAATWDNLTNGVDNGLAIASSPDGSRVYVGGVSRPAANGLDYVILSYAADTGQQLWYRGYSGVKTAAANALKAIGVSPDGSHVYVTGESEGVVREYDNDYLTLSLAADSGTIEWIARLDAANAGLSDRASDLSVADDGTIFVTGDSGVKLSSGSIRYDAVTVAYTPEGGTRWSARFIGPYGLEFGKSVSTGAGLVTVTSMGRGADARSGNDGTIMVYNLAGGAPLWLKRWQDSNSSEVPLTALVSRDGGVIYSISTAAPTVQYTSLTQTVVRAYSARSGSLLWQSRLDAGSLNAVTSKAARPLIDGGLAVVGDMTLSQNPLGPPSQNRYDIMTTVLGP